MNRSISRMPIIAAWCFTLAAALWIMSATASIVAVLAMVIIGLVPPSILMVLTRRPEQTTAEIIRAVDAGHTQ